MVIKTYDQLIIIYVRHQKSYNNVNRILCIRLQHYANHLLFAPLMISLLIDVDIVVWRSIGDVRPDADYRLKQVAGIDFFGH